MGVQLNRLGVPFVIRTEQECIGCGGCFLTCPEPGAITVVQIESAEA